MKRNNFGPEYRPVVQMTIVPNGITHRYRISPLDGPITETPHIEVSGIDLSRTYRYEAMDPETLALYMSVRALHQGIRSVSIGENALHVQGPQKFVRDRYRGNWPHNLDFEVLQCLKTHMGWVGDPYLTVREESSEEFWIKMRNREAIFDSGVTVNFNPLRDDM